jgi:hypothetical protein
MNVPAMDYIGLSFNVLFFLLCLCGYFYIMGKTGRNWAFLPIWASAWFVSGVSYVFLIVGVAAGHWSITLLRTALYVLFLAAISTSIAELLKLKKKE